MSLEHAHVLVRLQAVGAEVGAALAAVGHLQLINYIFNLI